MQNVINNPTPNNSEEFLKAILIIFFIFLTLLLSGKSDQEFKELEQEITTEILIDNKIITE